MSYSELIRNQVLLSGSKAILFAAELKRPLRKSDFECAEFHFMPSISIEKLDLVVHKSYQQSEKALTDILCSGSPNKKKKLTSK
jgi:hypothetical protein